MFISLIVPCYNCEKYLAACLDSLLNQNLQESEYEIICINDGSADNTSQILALYADKYQNLSVITQKNKGVSEARNAGLFAAKGDYIWFIDSDDLISRDALAKLYNKCSNGCYDRISFGIYRFDDGALIDLQDEYESSFNYYDGTVVASILSRSFLANNQLFFKYPEIVYGEDSLFMLEFKISKPIQTTLDEVLYFYRIHSGSAMTTQTKEAFNKQIVASVHMATIINSYYQCQLEPKTDIANLLMSCIWGAIYNSSREGIISLHNTIKDLKSKKLFPFDRPSECTLIKSYRTTRNDFIGKTFDRFFVNSNQYWGAIGLYIMVSIIRLKYFLQKKLLVMTHK